MILSPPALPRFEPALPRFEDVRAAASRLKGVAIHTPTLRSERLDGLTRGTILLKAECLQRTGSFKIRGAYNRLRLAIEGGEAPKAVVAFSSGNHAQGVAAAAAILGLPATIVMPADAPAAKINNTRALGAEIVLYDRWREDRERIARDIAAARGAVLVPPFDDPAVIAGQGTIGLEMVEAAAAAGLTLDTVLVPTSGGGLLAGMGLAFEGADPRIAIYSAEPADLDDHARSFASGQIVANDPAARSICDALQAPMPGRLTFELNRRTVSGGVVATDSEVLEAMRFAFETLKLVVEPGGAVALAALLAGRIDPRGRTIGVVLSGGNVDLAMFARAIC